MEPCLCSGSSTYCADEPLTWVTLIQIVSLAVPEWQPLQGPTASQNLLRSCSFSKRGVRRRFAEVLSSRSYYFYMHKMLCRFPFSPGHAELGTGIRATKRWPGGGCQILSYSMQQHAAFFGLKSQRCRCGSRSWVPRSSVAWRWQQVCWAKGVTTVRTVSVHRGQCVQIALENETCFMLQFKSKESELRSAEVIWALAVLRQAEQR